MELPPSRSLDLEPLPRRPAGSESTGVDDGLRRSFRDIDKIARQRLQGVHVRKTVLVYGALAGVLIAVLQLIQYRFLVVEHAVEIYGALIALLFAALGIWLGLRMTRPRETVIVKEVLVPGPAASPAQASGPFTPDPARMARFGITPREHEILQLIANGLSTREIAERLSVSENTVKTHASRLLDKLDARRRTQAVQVAKEAGLIP
jgi:DNA-binding CsgD family transcriptional regulator